MMVLKAAKNSIFVAFILYTTITAVMNDYKL